MNIDENDLTGGKLPSGSFGKNAACLEMAIYEVEVLQRAKFHFNELIN